MHTLREVTQVPASLESVFDFFNRPENLEKLTPCFLKFRVLTPVPLAMHNGAIFDYRIRLLGIPIRWTSIIAQYDPPHSFVDIQLRGPYSFWHHKHSFVQRGGGVEVTDEVHYDVGYFFMGKMLNALMIKHQLQLIFSYRKKAIQDLFGNRPE